MCGGGRKYARHSSLFIHSSVDGHLGSFHVFSFVNNAVMNMVV